jgi:hypothetical protein
MHPVCRFYLLWIYLSIFCSDKRASLPQDRVKKVLSYRAQTFLAEKDKKMRSLREFCVKLTAGVASRPKLGESFDYQNIGKSSTNFR